MVLCAARAQRVGTRLLDRRKRTGGAGWGLYTTVHAIALVLALQYRCGAQGVALGAHLVCGRMPGLSERQRAMCRAAPEVVAALGDGVRMGYEECRHQLAGRRWNCSGLGDGDIFGHVMVVASREAAFTYAITAAGVTYALTAACARGNISTCGCYNPYRRSLEAGGGTATGVAGAAAVAGAGFKWGGCSADVGYGVRYARRFLDSRELEGDARSLMNLHNNRVGRKIVRSMLRKECKCHGVSGSCALQTCWLALPSFRRVGDALAAKYRRARSVVPAPRLRRAPVDNDVGADNVQLVIKSRSRTQLGFVKKSPKKNELVYLQSSPNYCEPDVAVGSYGTHGRLCNRTSRGEDSCEVLCCGRGYNTVAVVRASQCRCKFHWCCRVTCDTCVERREDHTCK